MSLFYLSQFEDISVFILSFDEVEKQFLTLQNYAYVGGLRISSLLFADNVVILTSSGYVFQLALERWE